MSRAFELAGGMRRVTWHTVALLALLPAVASADLTGKWWFLIAANGSQPGGFTDAVQSGSTVTFLGLSGTFDGHLMSVRNDPFTPTIVITALVGADESRMSGAAVAVGISSVPFSAQRCECYDGNTVDGDGCDAHCQIEPCSTCSGTPSVCAPIADGGGCDDRHACTTGETCTANVCGGATSVPACVDVTGSWRVHLESEVGGPYEDRWLLEQTGTTLLFRAALGTIDPLSGAMNLEAPPSPCPLTIDAHASADGAHFSGTLHQFIYSVGAGECVEPFITTFTAERCACDDGNTHNGDGCGADCQVEPCFTCSGTPSVCTPLPDEAPCDDGNACTVGDRCHAHTCTSGAPEDCGPCLTCAPATGCVAAPRTPCRASLLPERSQFTITQSPDDRKDKLLWRWARGAATTFSELRNPQASDDYALCLFDDSGPLPTLLMRATAPAGACGNPPCWTGSSRGFAFHGDDGGDGLSALRLLAGDDGRAKVIAKGQGPGLSGRPYGLPAPPLPLPLRLQLQGDNGACFETRFDAAGVRTNVSGVFSARGAISPP